MSAESVRNHETSHKTEDTLQDTLQDTFQDTLQDTSAFDQVSRTRVQTCKKTMHVQIFLEDHLADFIIVSDFVRELMHCF